MLNQGGPLLLVRGPRGAIRRRRRGGCRSLQELGHVIELALLRTLDCTAAVLLHPRRRT